MLILKRDTWSEIFYALDKNKVRTALTIIGVVWGMLLFVFLLGLVNGLRNGFDRDLKGNSTNSLFVWTQQTSMPYEGFGRGRTFSLKTEDVDAVKNRFEHVNMVVPRNRQSATIVHGTAYSNYSIYGDYPEQNKMFVKKVIHGRFINDDDFKNESKVVVIGDGVIEDIYKKGDQVIGSLLRINNIAFTVVGIYEGQPNGFEGNQSVFMPFTTFQKLFNQGNNVGFMAINIKDEYDIKQAEEQIIQFLKTRHKVHPDDTQALGSFNLGAMFAKLFNFMKGLEFLTVAVGFLTLLAGVIAVSSILLISVKERTKEFGIRRALGAKPSQIIGQILLESAVITFFSGLIGIIVGTLILASINNYIENQPDSNVPVVNSSVDIYVLSGAFLLVLVMAVLAGLIPAMRAISIKPIDALREE
ncbi:MAG: ABC transporter permease [Flavobacteriaceae bacterium]|nr:ABC transporter permease [Flavobacteriaceae bacterium]